MEDDIDINLHDDYFRFQDNLRVLNEKSQEVGRDPSAITKSLKLSDFDSIKYAANERSLSAITKVFGSLAGIESLTEEQKVSVVMLMEANYTEAFFVGELVGKEKEQYESS